MKRRKVISLIAGLAIAWPLASFALQPKQPLKRVGVLPSVVPCPLQPDNIVVRRLGELGWREGQTVGLDCVSALGPSDQVPALARELVLRRPDVLIAAPFNFVSALKQETTTTPIIMLGTWEPVRVGLITSLAQPGGNVTGVAWFNMLPKQMELLKDIVPNLRRVAYIIGAPSAYSPPRKRRMNSWAVSLQQGPAPAGYRAAISCIGTHSPFAALERFGLLSEGLLPSRRCDRHAF